MSDEAAPPAPGLPLDPAVRLDSSPPPDRPDGDEFEGDPGDAVVSAREAPVATQNMEEEPVDQPPQPQATQPEAAAEEVVAPAEERNPEATAEAEAAPGEEKTEEVSDELPKTLAELADYEINIEDPNNPENKFKVKLADLADSYSRVEATKHIVSNSEGITMEFSQEKIVEAAAAIQNSQGARDIKGGQENLERFQAERLKPHLDRRNVAVRAYHAEVERARQDGDGVSPEISTAKDDLVDSYGRLKVEHEKLKGEQATREDSFSTLSMDSIWQAAFPGSDIGKDSTKRAQEVNNVSGIVAQKYNMSHRELAIAAYQNPGVYRMLLDALSKDVSRHAGSEAKLAKAVRVRTLTLKPGSTSRAAKPARAAIRDPNSEEEAIERINAAHVAAGLTTH